MKQVLFQHGTLALLVPGLLTGTLTIKELLQHGDTGIGTGEGLDGELVILQRQAYQVQSTGHIRQVPGEFMVPFANIHHADYQPLAQLSDLTQAQLYQQLNDRIKAPNTFYSVKITGTFAKMHTRAASKSTPPYATLLATAQNQQEFTAENVSGTLLSYYSPELFHGAAVAGYHSHFLAEDLTIGGHVLDFALTSGQVQVQVFDTLEQHLPIENQEFMQHDFTKDNISSDISQSE
ncbi:acetolactate decarboxylase [Bombilactobacillus bombi]|uniref:Alpha-acetolactate decarboxylase n=1 Tax=Bombilactobacillus bombi TaxID=1303590 RepID=A0A3R6YQR5_9LACO|nr:acetolactate decarboxylase [Bombilactobacillus bombi]RHW48751.1 acetolactate decarboxylase [Bombilactobacillus bombi]